jgi:hypothetical protein
MFGSGAVCAGYCILEHLDDHDSCHGQAGGDGRRPI